jgi:hypothetical protein
VSGALWDCGDGLQEARPGGSRQVAPARHPVERRAGTVSSGTTLEAECQLRPTDRFAIEWPPGLAGQMLVRMGLKHDFSAFVVTGRQTHPFAPLGTRMA